MKKIKSKKRILVCFCVVMLFSVSVFGLQANAKFRSDKVLATASVDTAAVTLKNDASTDVYAKCPSLNSHFGDWNTGNAFNAEFHFKSSGDAEVIPAPQLDIIGTDGNSYNTYFTGTYSITAGSLSETDIAWADEQTSNLELPAGEKEIVVSYTLTVKTALPTGVSLVPEFSCALIQKDNQETGFRASCRKIGAGTQTGFTAAIGKDKVHDENGNLFKDTYQAASYKGKTFSFTVTPDDADTTTTVNIYKLDNTTDTTTYKSAEKLISGETFTSAREYNIKFAAREGMSCIIVVDAENATAGHRLYKYVIAWPAGGELGYTKTELKIDGSGLN